MYRPIKRRRKCTFDVQRLSDTHYHAKATVDFESPYKVKNRHYEFPIDDTTIFEVASSKGMEILMPPLSAQTSYPVAPPPEIAIDERLYPHQKTGVIKAAAWGRAMIGDEMGVGKSAQGIALALPTCARIGSERWSFGIPNMRSL